MVEIACHHVGFTVSNLDRAVAFYQDTLGFVHERTSDLADDFASEVTGLAEARMRVAFMRLGELTLELLEYQRPAAARDAFHSNTPGHGHLCFQVEEIGDLVERIEAQGGRRLGKVTTIPGGPNQGGRVVYVRDPNGVVVEFIQRWRMAGAG